MFFCVCGTIVFYRRKLKNETTIIISIQRPKIVVQMSTIKINTNNKKTTLKI